MTNPLFSFEQLPATSAAAIREFNDRYIASIGAAQPPTWSDFGDLIPSNSPMITFPISALGLKYRQTQGGSRFKSLLEKSFDLKVEEMDEGIEAKVSDLLSKVFAYRNWQQGPARLVVAEARLRNRSIQALLEVGESTLWGASLANPTGIDTRNFFSATHLSNFNDAGSTTWSNYQAAAKDVMGSGGGSIDYLQAEVTAMQGVLDENGEKVGAEADTILVPTAKYEPLKNMLAKELILDTQGSAFAATNNPYKGRFNVVHVPELSNQNDWYLVDSKLKSATGLAPWISARWTNLGSALEMRVYDESTDFFRDTGHIKISSHVWYGFTLGFPHCIRKVKGA